MMCPTTRKESQEVRFKERMFFTVTWRRMGGLCYLFVVQNQTFIRFLCMGVYMTVPAFPVLYAGSFGLITISLSRLLSGFSPGCFFGFFGMEREHY